MRPLAACFLMLAFALPSAGAESSQYFAFVGEKISVTAVPPAKGEVPFDSEFLARYRVLEPYRGAYSQAEIEFTAFDHYGVPSFADYEHVLLYLELHDGKYYHAKYQYSPLYRTRDGRWASYYAASDYQHEFNKGTSIRPERIDFLEPVEVDIPARMRRRDIEKWFPKPYFRIEGRKAIAVYGNYIPELFQLKQNGVLKARGDFQETERAR